MSFFLSAASHHVHISNEYDSWNYLLKAQLSLFVFSSTDRIKSLLMQSDKHFNVTNMGWRGGCGVLAKVATVLHHYPSSKRSRSSFSGQVLPEFYTSPKWLSKMHDSAWPHITTITQYIVVVMVEWILTLVNYRWLNYNSNWEWLWLILIQIECC